MVHRLHTKCRLTTSAELNVRLGAAEFFPGASRQVRRVRKRRREGNEGTARVERRYTIQRMIRWLKNRCQVGPTILRDQQAGARVRKRRREMSGRRRERLRVESRVHDTNLRSAG